MNDESTSGRLAYRVKQLESNPSVAFPIGSIFLSVVSTNPNTLLGYGTWSQLKDRFLLGAGNTYTNGNTGGSATHTLTINEIPSHRHSAQGYRVVKSDGGGVAVLPRNVISADAVDTNPPILSAGGGQAHNNMPPYLVVYMWKRTA